jgi:alkaline phosphatase D
MKFTQCGPTPLIPAIDTLRYINLGNSKFGAITIEKLSDEQSSLKYTAYIDGTNAWNLTILSPATAYATRVKGSLWDRIRGL